MKEYLLIFGLKIPGKEDVLISSESNAEFEVLRKRIMVSIFQGIHGGRNPLCLEMSDQVTLQLLLNNLREKI